MELQLRFIAGPLIVSVYELLQVNGCPILAAGVCDITNDTQSNTKKPGLQRQAFRPFNLIAQSASAAPAR